MTHRFDTAYHAPVLVEEILALFAGARRALDGTLGGGGHTAAMLEAGMSVTGIDRDPEAIAEAGARHAEAMRAGTFRVVQGNYADADVLLAEHAGMPHVAAAASAGADRYHEIARSSDPARLAFADGDPTMPSEIGVVELHDPGIA